MKFRKSLASFPSIQNSPMCDTSNIPTLSRTHLCSIEIPSYCIGILNPPKFTILAPCLTC